MDRRLVANWFARVTQAHIWGIPKATSFTIRFDQSSRVASEIIDKGHHMASFGRRPAAEGQRPAKFPTDHIPP